MLYGVYGLLIFKKFNFFKKIICYTSIISEHFGAKILKIFQLYPELLAKHDYQVNRVSSEI